MPSDDPTDRSKEARELVLDVIATLALGVAVALLLALTLLAAVWLGAEVI